MAPREKPIREVGAPPVRARGRFRPRDDQARGRHFARRLALAALFEAEFGLRSPAKILDRHLTETEAEESTASYARVLVEAVGRHRGEIDELISSCAPQHPLLSLARMDRSLLRLAISEVLHSPAAPARVAIAEWVELARIYSGEPARKLVNGVLGRIARTVLGSTPGFVGPAEPSEIQPDSTAGGGVSGHDLRASQEDRRRAARRGRG